ncbi:DUF1990 family protein [Microlunatus antarcticus]|uniref:Uncharacterized protein (UPF0548 family) n=1 Tax=Microlunatus antarcticus TaxID=53388 RepID=A0A7W5P5D4_9ACTN|nr:uncharacterized protein (UPF0548 family) [Microlunatus antarcticus]
MTTADLADLALTYDEVGATSGTLPVGYHHLDVSRVVGQGRDWFDVAAARVLTWEVQRRAGLTVDASGAVALGVRAVLRMRVGPVLVRAPVEVVVVTVEPDRVGFAYGTLAGHPERGEERFEVALRADGAVEARIRAFSRPGAWFTHLAGPVGRRLQRSTAARYLDALTQPS